MSARTPGPWRWDRHPHAWPNCDRPSEGDHVPILYKDDEGLDRPDPGIRVASFSDTSWHKASTLAAFMVEACNSHDTLTADNARLREALASSLRAWECLVGNEEGPCDETIGAVINKSRAALAGGEK